MNRLTLHCLIAACLLSVTACNHLPDWLGAEEKEDILPGERIALKRTRPLFEAEIPAADGTIQLPPARKNESWTQPLGSATGVSDHLELPTTLAETVQVTVGNGDSFQGAIVPAPVVENGRVFALDGNGTLSAYQADSMALLWQSSILESEDSDDALLGGGLAVAGSVVYAASNEGRIVSLSTEDGHLFWQQELQLPLRSAPRLIGKTVLIQTADNQLLALNRRDGEIRWNHQGLNDSASQLQAIVPAAGGELVLATYSSGEVTALSLNDGAVLWSDMLAGSAQTALEDDRFGAMTAMITPRVAFAGSPQSFSAYITGSGRRIWERRIPLATMPWLAGTTLYMLTADSQLLAINGSNGKILWTHNLPAENDKEAILWQHPVVASNQVLMVGSHGKMHRVNALTGEVLEPLDIPENISAEPVITNGVLYLLDRSARLHVLR